MKKKGGGSKNSSNSNQDFGLDQFIPEAIRAHFWGEEEATTASESGAAEEEPLTGGRRSKKKNSNNNLRSDEHCLRHLVSTRCPALQVYVISTSPVHLQSVARLFSRVPALVFELKADDFVQNVLLNTNDDASAADTAAPMIAAYRGMGVDRVAQYCAARQLFPRASAHLVIDGGTALTYTTAISTAITGDDGENDKLSLAGGIGPGLALSCRALYEYTVTALPHAAPLFEAVTERLAQCEAQQKVRVRV